MLDIVPIMYTNPWKPKVKPYMCQHLFPFHQSLSPEVGAQALSDTFNQAFLRNSETLPVIISSNLDKDQEGKLLDFLVNVRKL